MLRLRRLLWQNAGPVRWLSVNASQPSTLMQQLREGNVEAATAKAPETKEYDNKIDLRTTPIEKKRKSQKTSVAARQAAVLADQKHITDQINQGIRLSRNLIEENAYLISLFKKPDPQSVKKSVSQIVDNAKMDFVDESKLNFEVRFDAPGIKLKKNKTFGHTYFFVEMPHVFQKPNEVFVMAEDPDMVRELYEAGFKPHAFDSQGVRIMLTNPLTHDIYACEKGLVKKMNREQRFQDKLGNLKPTKIKNTTSESFAIAQDWVKELVRLRDKCLVCQTDNNKMSITFGSGDLEREQLSSNLSAILRGCVKSVKEIANVEISYGNDEWLEILPGVGSADRPKYTGKPGQKSIKAKPKK